MKIRSGLLALGALVTLLCVSVTSPAEAGPFIINVQFPGSGYQQPTNYGYPQPYDYGYQQPVNYGYQQPYNNGYQQPVNYSYQQPYNYSYQQPYNYGYTQRTTNWGHAQRTGNYGYSQRSGNYGQSQRTDAQNWRNGREQGERQHRERPAQTTNNRVRGSNWAR